MPIVKVQARGQITIPKNIRKRLGCKPGDTLFIDTAGPDTAKLTVLQRPMTLEESFERFHIEGPVDWHKDREEWEAAAADEFVGKLEDELRHPRH